MLVRSVKQIDIYESPVSPVTLCAPVVQAVDLLAEHPELRRIETQYSSPLFPTHYASDDEAGNPQLNRSKPVIHQSVN